MRCCHSALAALAPADIFARVRPRRANSTAPEGTSTLVSSWLGRPVALAPAQPRVLAVDMMDGQLAGGPSPRAALNVPGVYKPTRSIAHTRSTGAVRFPHPPTTHIAERMSGATW